MPEEGVPASERETLLSFEQIARLVRIFRTLGVQTIRLTGGEPLIRKELPTLVAMIKDEGIDDIALTTNATALAPTARKLHDAGLTRLNISLDSVDPQTFAEMTRGGDLNRVVKGIEAAREAGFSGIKTNAVVVRGLNDHQLEEIVEWGWARELLPRFIELMPIGAAEALGPERVVPVKQMLHGLSHLLWSDTSPSFTENRGPAGYFDARDGSGKKVGFIGAVTENFCERCNRIRVTAQGDIRPCLASPDGLALKPLLEREPEDRVIVERIQETLFGKRDGHRFEIRGEKHSQVAMSGVGG